jgi:lactoylglutathione lyase
MQLADTGLKPGVNETIDWNSKMKPETKTEPNVKQAVPFFMVSDIDASVKYYVDGLGFQMTHRWVDDGKLQWCWLVNGTAGLMLQEICKVPKEGHQPWTPQGKLGEGVSICFICEDALSIYHDVTSRGIQASKPFVGNAMWVTSTTDPDGYRLDFESPTDAPEETEYSGEQS